MTVKQADQKLQHDRQIQPCSLFPGSLVMIRDYNDPSKWIPGVVIRKSGPVAYDIETTQGQIVKHHIDQIRLRNNTMEATGVPPVTILVYLTTISILQLVITLQYNTVQLTLNLNADTLNVCVVLQIVLYQILMDMQLNS